MRTAVRAFVVGLCGVLIGCGGQSPEEAIRALHFTIQNMDADATPPSVLATVSLPLTAGTDVEVSLNGVQLELVPQDGYLQFTQAFTPTGFDPVIPPADRYTFHVETGSGPSFESAIDAPTRASFIWRPATASITEPLSVAWSAPAAPGEQDEIVFFGPDGRFGLQGPARGGSAVIDPAQLAGIYPALDVAEGTNIDGRLALVRSRETDRGSVLESIDSFPLTITP